MKQNKFELKSDGSIERVGPFGSYGPTVEASNKTDAQQRFLEFAYRALEHAPKVKIRNGAYQLSYEGMNQILVESGVEGRDMSLCLSSVTHRGQLTDNCASFDYYASNEYREASNVA